MLNNASSLARPLARSASSSLASASLLQQLPQQTSRASPKTAVFWDSGERLLFSRLAVRGSGQARKWERVELDADLSFFALAPENTNWFSTPGSLLFLSEIKRRVARPISFIRMYEGKYERDLLSLSSSGSDL
jgi:hypothetical protein